MIIYKITNIVTGKVYIGQTIMPLIRRWRVHKSVKRRSPLCSSIKKHGAHNFTIEPLCSVIDLAHLDDLEIYFISYFNCVYPNGYNLTTGGQQGAHTRGKAPWNKGKTASSEAILNQSNAHLGQAAWNKGQVTSEETKLKQSAKKVGKRMSPATEYKKGQESTFKGKKHTPEALALISAHGNRRAVLCVETGTVYASILDAAKQLGIAKSYMRRLVQSETLHKKTGFTFKFVDNK